ncbi:hypothetical protein [Streptomyces sp. NPDC051776]|uniref:hypothetical protein n=1 Tax=Streptomyces sp. NPDC051776 TaxID=3155414 RepID=UPI00343F0365
MPAEQPAAQRFGAGPAQIQAAASAANAPNSAPVTSSQPPVAPVVEDADRSEDGRAIVGAPQPCVLCGKPTPYRAGGTPQHIAGACLTTSGPAPVEKAHDAPQEPASANGPATAPIRRRSATQKGAGRTEDALAAEVLGKVEEVLEKHAGDLEAAGKELIKKAIPDVMAFFHKSRIGGRYEHSDFPPTTDILKKRKQKGADQIWEGRPKWRNTALFKAARTGQIELQPVTALDMNAAYSPR